MKPGRFVSKNSLWIFHIMAVFVVTAWGISFVSTRVLLDNGLTPMEIYLYRFFLAYICMFAITHRKMWANTIGDEIKFLLCGMVAGSVYFISENVALEYTLVSNVSLITSLSPLLTVLLAGVIYRTDRPGGGVYVGSVMAFVGVGMVIFNSSFNMSINPIGDMLALLAALCWAIYSLLLKPLNVHYDARFITRKVFFYGMLTTLPFFAVDPHLVPLSTLLRPEVCLNLLFLGLVCSLGCFLIWAVIVPKIGAIQANNYLYFQPVVTMIFSLIILHESVTLVGGIGCGLILAGVWLSDYLQKIEIFRKK